MAPRLRRWGTDTAGQGEEHSVKDSQLACYGREGGYSERKSNEAFCVSGGTDARPASTYSQVHAEAREDPEYVASEVEGTRIDAADWEFSKACHGCGVHQPIALFTEPQWRKAAGGCRYSTKYWWGYKQ